MQPEMAAFFFSKWITRTVPVIDVPLIDENRPRDLGLVSPFFLYRIVHLTEMYEYSTLKL